MKKRTELPYTRLTLVKTANFASRKFAVMFRQFAERSHACSATVALANETKHVQMIAFENELTLGADGWVKISPYGDFPKERSVKGPDGSIRAERYIQRLDRAAAETMADKSNSLWGKVKRFFVGKPIYKRHPDLSTHSPHVISRGNDDTRPYGVFSQLEARDDGFYGKAVMTSEGQQAIENEGLKYLSPFWWAKPVGEEGGVQVVSPFDLISAGLTDRPNIQGGQALANSNETEMNKTLLIGILALANEASDSDITSAINALKAKADKVPTLEQNAAAASTALENEKTAHAATKTALENERAGRITLLIDTAIADGRITPAQRAQWETDLKSDFAGKSVALANSKPTMHTRASTGNLGHRTAEANPVAVANSQFIALTNERMEKAGIGWTEAWNQVKAEKPDLYAKMQPSA